VRVGEGRDVRVAVAVAEAVGVADSVIVNDGSIVNVPDGNFVAVGDGRIPVWDGDVFVGSAVTTADRLANPQARETRIKTTNGNNRFSITNLFIYYLPLRCTFKTAIFVA
jgi:hypothetical protein